MHLSETMSIAGAPAVRGIAVVLEGGLLRVHSHSTHTF